MKSYEEWDGIGYRVRKGEHAHHYAVNPEDPRERVALFTSQQVFLSNSQDEWPIMTRDEANALLAPPKPEPEPESIWLEEPQI